MKPKLLLQKLRKELHSAADPSRAPKMQAYIKSEMPYHGVPAPLVRSICKSVFADLDFSHMRPWKDSVLYLWRNAKFREERYCALLLCADRRALAFQAPSALKMYEEMIVSGAWWDYVDTLSSRVGEILRQHPQKMKPKMLAWSKSPNIWKRRTSILCQLSFKKNTDLNLLYACIEPSLGRKEFFLQKGIGWALRQHAWTDPKEVRRYVKAYENRLAPLSRREALKNL